jgi:hypothetical protein
MKFSEADINNMSWEEVQSLTEVLSVKVKEFFSGHNESVHVISPLLRTGGIVGGIMAIKNKVEIMLPVQFKYTYNPKAIIQITSVPDLLVDVDQKMNILLCEGNTSSGSIAVRAAEAIHEKYPTAKIYLATLTKVYGGPELLEGIQEIFYGRLSNENKTASNPEIEALNIRKGITIFPWEDPKSELEELNG